MVQSGVCECSHKEHDTVVKKGQFRKQLLLSLSNTSCPMRNFNDTEKQTNQHYITLKILIKLNVSLYLLDGMVGRLLVFNDINTGNR